MLCRIVRNYLLEIIFRSSELLDVRFYYLCTWFGDFFNIRLSVDYLIDYTDPVYGL